MCSSDLDECHRDLILPSGEVLEQNRIHVKAFFVINALYCVNIARLPHTGSGSAGFDGSRLAFAYQPHSHCAGGGPRDDAAWEMRHSPDNAGTQEDAQ